MTIHFVFSAVIKDGNFCLGYKNDLLFKLKGDLGFFKKLTVGHTIVMGKNTWVSLPKKPLQDRENIIITTKEKGLRGGAEFMELRTFKTLVLSYPEKNYYVIGGPKLFESFMEHFHLRPSIIHITHITPKALSEIKYDAYTKLPDLQFYKLQGYSEKFTEGETSYRFLHYKSPKHYPEEDFINYHLSFRWKHQEYKYLKVLEELCSKTEMRTNRTGTPTLSIFNKNIEYDIRDSIPLITTKYTKFKNIVEETLWILKGQSDSKILESRGVNIWKGNTSKEFLKSRNLDYKEGELGPMYGYQLRNFGGKYPEKGGVDQLEYVENLLKTDPFSRRIIITLLNPTDYDKGVLLPCHHYIQFYVEEISGQKYLSCFFNMRSSDFPIAHSYNTVSYSILTYILAKRCDMLPKSIVYSAVDCHMYISHLEAVKTQLRNPLRPEPTLKISDSVKTKSYEEITAEDIELIGYFPNKSIKMEMAI